MPDEAALQRLIDRQSIIDCLLRYARGVDRGDYALMASAYHEDALEDHGYFVGKGTDLVKWSAAYRRDNPGNHIVRHVMSNHYHFRGCFDEAGNGQVIGQVSTLERIARLDLGGGQSAIAAVHLSCGQGH